VIKLVLSEITEAVGGTCRGEPPTVSVSGVTIDSRKVSPGELFFAIPGPRFDGHDFAASALADGAVAAVVAADMAERSLARFPAEMAADGWNRLIEVPDTVAALGRLAAFHRRQLSADVIAVVGSNGKTTTKAMIDHVLGARLKGRCSPKSFNNSIGVPLTLLAAQSSDEYLVVEIGTNAPGEIAALGQMAEPNMAVITCVAEEHLEGLGDIEGVATEETSILRTLRSGGFAAVNIDAPEVRERLPEAKATVCTFGRNPDADVVVTEVRYEPPWTHFVVNGRFAYRLSVLGAHNAMNATAAIVVGRRLGFEHEEIAARLETFAALPMRNEIVEIGALTVVNDAYNANPHSAIAALDVLQSIAGRRRIAVFGEMRELGPRAADLHRGIAERLARYDIDRVVLIGPAAEMMHDALLEQGLSSMCVERCATVEACGEYLSGELRDGDVVLLKGSRAVGLERLIEPMRRRFEAMSAA
jgi:UDP-N-acetylmuramoyl-tripeptide--D-alanyl-D-alanine ligase